MKKGILSLFIMALVLIFTGSVYAGSTTSTLGVSVNAVAACTIVSTTSVTFPDYDGTSSVSANGDITVNCSSGTAYNIALDAGLNYDGIVYRYVGGSIIPYALYQDVVYTTYWGDADFDNTYTAGTSLADTGDGTDQAHTVYGRLVGGYSASPGPYSDTVTVTVYW